MFYGIFWSSKGPEAGAERMGIKEKIEQKETWVEIQKK